MLVLKKGRAMKKLLCLFILLTSFKSSYCYQSQLHLKTSIEDRQKGDSDSFGHLKRRYPRKYNFKRNLNRLERDDFGYTPF